MNRIRARILEMLDAIDDIETFVRPGRADSLAALRPETEAQAAIARGDLRFVGVCGDSCIAPGVPRDSVLMSADSLAVSVDSLQIVAGTSDDVINGDVARLNKVADEYAARYNALIWRKRRQRRGTS